MYKKPVYLDTEPRSIAHMNLIKMRFMLWFQYIASILRSSCVLLECNIWFIFSLCEALHEALTLLWFSYWSALWLISEPALALKNETNKFSGNRNKSKALVGITYDSPEQKPPVYLH